MATYGGDNDQLQLTSYTKNPYVIAELLKVYLASLPEPLLTFQLYDSFLLTQTIHLRTDRVWAYRFLLAYLPPGFRASVKLLLTLLSNLSKNSEFNRMDALALAEVFAPYFLRPDEELYYMKDDRPLIVNIVALLIQEYVFFLYLFLGSDFSRYESVLRASPAGTNRGLPPTPLPVSKPAVPAPTTTSVANLINIFATPSPDGKDENVTKPHILFISIPYR